MSNVNTNEYDIWKDSNINDIKTNYIDDSNYFLKTFFLKNRKKLLPNNTMAIM